MSAHALSAAEIRAHVAAVCKKQPEAKVIGIHSPSPWLGPPAVTVDGSPVDVVGCQSSLEVRESLAGRSAESGRLVIVTPLTDHDLGHDVLARLARRRLLQPEPWRLVMELFRARDIDPRLLGHRWIAEALLEAVPADGYPPVAAGVLSAETVWGVVLSRRLGMPTPRPDAVAVLRWCATSPPPALAPEVRDGVRAWIAETARPAGAAIFESATGSSELSPVAMGLVLGVVGAQPADPALRDAAVRVERYIGGRRLDTREAMGWAAAAEQMVLDAISRDDRRLARQWVERADAMLSEVGAGAQAWHSAYLPSGLNQRIDRFASALSRVTDRPYQPARREDAAAAYAQVAAHRLIGWSAERLDRLAMALRAATWLSGPAEAANPASCSDAVRRYVDHESFVDWARTSLRGADPSPAVREVCDTLLAAVRERRDAQNAHFGSLLANWLQLGQAAGFLPIERVLDEVVVPVSGIAPVLVLVMDGMSVAIGHELLEAVERDGWAPVNRAGGGALQPVLAACPTVTEVCRMSLLSGSLRRGVASDEKTAFATHQGLAAASSARRPPLMLHKGDLSDGAGGLSADAAGEVGNPDRRVVGVVLNAVDDHLLKADGVRPHWTADYVQLLMPLLHAARAAGRFVVLTSDHGHVLEDGSSARPGGDADRWRPVQPPPGDGEVLLSGHRVVAEGQSIVAAWSERVRYRSQKNGYHGGASPQEVVVPLAILAPAEPADGEWVEQVVHRPAWWSVELAGQGAQAPAAPPAPVRRPESRTPLLDVVEPPAAPDDAAAWIERLFASRPFVEQRRSANRVPLADDRIRQVLAALNERGGRMTREALAMRVSVPAIRLTGQLAALRQLLNVDGYAVLSVDEASDTVELNIPLLLAQFEL